MLLEHSGEGEDVAHVVVDNEHLLAGKDFIGAMEILERSPALVVEVGNIAMQEIGRLVQQTLGRVDCL